MAKVGTTRRWGDAVESQTLPGKVRMKYAIYLATLKVRSDRLDGSSVKRKEYWSKEQESPVQGLYSGIRTIHGGIDLGHDASRILGKICSIEAISRSCRACVSTCPRIFTCLSKFRMGD